MIFLSMVEMNAMVDFLVSRSVLIQIFLGQKIEGVTPSKIVILFSPSFLSEFLTYFPPTSSPFIHTERLMAKESEGTHAHVNANDLKIRYQSRSSYPFNSNNHFFGFFLLTFLLFVAMPPCTQAQSCSSTCSQGTLTSRSTIDTCAQCSSATQNSLVMRLDPTGGDCSVRILLVYCG